jgi:hypothetical protein
VKKALANSEPSTHGHECDLRAARTNVHSWEINGLNADIAFGPVMTQSGSWQR